MDITRDNIEHQHNSIEQYERLQELADSYTAVGDYAQAQLCYEKAANLAPDEPGPYLGLGVVALQKDLLEDAEIAFRVACRLDSSCARAYAGLGMIAQERADYKHAFDMYLKCLELDTDNLIALLGLFQASCQMGSFAKVIHFLEVYLSMHPGDTSVMFPLAALYMKDGKFEKSRMILSDLLNLDPDHEDAANLLEELEHNLGRKTHKTASATECMDQITVGVKG